MQRVAVIALNTFRESLRDRILYNLLLFALLLMGMSMLMGSFTIAEQKRIVTDLGMAAINLVGVMSAVFVGIGLVSKEIERRTVYTIMARPISRTQFILGKYMGLALTLLVNLGIMLVMYVATLWINDVAIHGGLFQAVGLIYIELLLVTAAALLFSTFSSASVSAMMTLGIYVIGHLTPDLKGIAEKSADDLARRAVTAIYYLCPNLETLNMKGQAAQGLAVPFTYLAMASTYGLLYTLVLLTLACTVFSRRDF